MSNVFALIDGNNFYASCERIFAPQLNNKPVIVLSNNDGCVIARSKESKHIGIPMGAPFFKITDLIERYKVNVFSSNFTLYADISNRVVETLKQFSPNIEVYSIDESFLELSEIQNIKNFHEYGVLIRNKIKKDIGIPVGIGIAKTKTLAKLANKISKNTNGVLDFVNLSNSEIDEYLKKISVEDIWGIGYKSVKKLNDKGIITAYDFKYSDSKSIKKLLKINGEKTRTELHNISCLGLDTPKPKKCIASTRSFGKYINNLGGLEEAITLYVSRAAEKLRSQESTTSCLCVFIRTNKHSKNPYLYSRSQWISIRPTSSTIEITKEALKILRTIYKPGFMYSKAGILLGGIHSNKVQSFDILSTPKILENTLKLNKISEVTDKINKKFGDETIFLASRGIDMDWKMNQNKKSPRYTTSWNELPIVRI